MAVKISSAIKINTLFIKLYPIWLLIDKLNGSAKSYYSKFGLLEGWRSTPITNIKGEGLCWAPLLLEISVLWQSYSNLNHNIKHTLPEMAKIKHWPWLDNLSRHWMTPTGPCCFILLLSTRTAHIQWILFSNKQPTRLNCIPCSACTFINFHHIPPFNVTAEK